MRIILVALFLLIHTTGAYAVTRYVSDELVITLREGKGDESRAIDHISTGTPVEVLSEEGEFLHIRTQKGTEGWVRKRYITSETPKAVVIANLKKEIEDRAATSGDVGNLAAERDRLQAENERLKATNEALRAETESFERSEMYYWFLAGAGVLFIGWLIGRASRQKRYY